MIFRFDKTDVAITHRDADHVMGEITRRLTDGQGFALATLNLDHLVKLRSSAAFRQAYGAHDLVVADGNPIVWLSKLARRPVSLVPGSDLVVPLVQAAGRTGRPVVLIGSSDAALQGAGDDLARKVPGLRIAARIAPRFGFDPEGAEARDIPAQVAEVGPCLCLIALGAPKQEIFAALGRTLAPQAGFASIGAGLDFLSGHQIRAPEWVRAMALEWAWRMVNSPRRLLPRYAACAAILPGQAAQALRLRAQ